MSIRVQKECPFQDAIQQPGQLAGGQRKDVASEEDPIAQLKIRRAPVVAGIGLLVGLLAMGCTILAYHVLESQPATTTTVKAFGISWNRSSRTPAAEPGLLSSETMRWWGIGLGGGAIVLGGLAWLRREGMRSAMVPFFFGVAAIAWMQFVVVLAVLVFTGLLYFFGPMEISSD